MQDMTGWLNHEDGTEVSNLLYKNFSLKLPNRFALWRRC